MTLASKYGVHCPYTALMHSVIERELHAQAPSARGRCRDPALTGRYELIATDLTMLACVSLAKVGKNADR